MTHVEVTRDPEASQYVATLDGARAGFIDYFARAGVVELIHTEVDDAFAGKGIASTLARHALDDIRSQSMQVIATCEYVRAWIEKHPAYQDLVVRNTAG